MTQKIAFGGGCHWCTEAVFQSLKGVSQVDQGFVASTGSNSAFSEAVIVHFDDEVISLKDLIEVHLYSHASTSDHAMRGKYRSAVYTFSDHPARQVELILESLQSDFEDKLVTTVLPFEEFRSSEKQFVNYYQDGPDKPFCRTYIWVVRAPALTLLVWHSFIRLISKNGAGACLPTIIDLNEARQAPFNPGFGSLNRYPASGGSKIWMFTYSNLI